MGGSLSATLPQELFEYGIHTEGSDVRAHVSVSNRVIYVFRTTNGINAIYKNNPPLVTATQPGANGVPTATGWLVKHEWIDDLRRLSFHSWPRWDEFSNSMTTSQKGGLAVECVVCSMKLGRFPFWIVATEDDRKNVQINGTDIVVFARQRVQVKCDWRAGETGNLYLQKSERNPFKRR